MIKYSPINNGVPSPAKPKFVWSDIFTVIGGMFLYFWCWGGFYAFSTQLNAITGMTFNTLSFHLLPARLDHSPESALCRIVGDALWTHGMDCIVLSSVTAVCVFLYGMALPSVQPQVRHQNCFLPLASRRLQAVLTLFFWPHRPVVVCGAILQAAAYLSSSFVYDFKLMTVTFGVLGGIGASCMAVGGITVVGQKVLPSRVPNSFLFFVCLGF